MKTSAGLWIDHREAVIVFVSPKGETTKVIQSNVKSRRGRIGSVHAMAPDDRRQSSFTEHLNGYYDKVAAAIRGVGLVLILGPGEAKDELKRRIEEHKPGKSVVAVATADKMTDRQVAAKVRKHFHISDRARTAPRG